MRNIDRALSHGGEVLADVQRLEMKSRLWPFTPKRGVFFLAVTAGLGFGFFRHQG